MIRVVVTGSECTGKTTLAQTLAEHYGTIWVPEYVRQFVLEKGSPPECGDVEEIARGQVALEEEHLAAAVKRSSGLLIQDTDLLSTVVYSHHYYGDCPAWVERTLRERVADLYLLAGIDVPWVADGDRRDRGDRREEMQQLFSRALKLAGLPCAKVRGSRHERLEAARTVIDGLVARSAGPAGKPSRPW